MNEKGNKPVEEEFRSSQIYKTLTGVGIPVADKIAKGLDKAAESIDSALNGISPAVKRSAGRTYPPSQGPSAPYGGSRGNGPQPGAGAGKAPGGHPYAYQYSYQYGSSKAAQTSQTAPGSVPPPKTQGAQPSQPGRKPAGVNPAPAPQMPQMKLVRKGSPMKFYLTGAAALAYALWFPLYQPSHFIIFGLILCGVFLLSSKIFRGKKEFVPIEPPKPKEEPKKKNEEPKEEPAKSTGNPEVDKIISDGNQYLKKLRAANDAIPDEALSEDISRMEKASADIFRFIADHPEKASQIRKFMSYYLPTTLKLLNSYQRLSAQSVKGENITSTMFNIAGMMHTVADAFEKQLDSLFTDEAMDVSADISVFETLLKQEGFVDEEKSRPGN